MTDLLDIEFNVNQSLFTHPAAAGLPRAKRSSSIQKNVFFIITIDKTVLLKTFSPTFAINLQEFSGVLQTS